MNMDLYWQLGDLYTAMMREVGRNLTYHEYRRNRSQYFGPNKHDTAANKLTVEHLALVKVWAAYHFSSWPPETVRRLQEELQDWHSHCSTYHPAHEPYVTQVLEVALARFESVLEPENQQV